MPPRLLLLAGMSCLVACREGNVTRSGAEQTKLVAATIPVALPALRDAILKKFTTQKADLPRPFSSMTIFEASAFPDAGSGLSVDLRKQDLVLRDPTYDVYWTSEYRNQRGPVKFQCGFVIRLDEASAASTRVEVYETSPAVWVGMYWTLGHSGPGRYMDIRPVEPTVQDRVALLQLIRATSSDA